jgi:IclR family pca regulon transcriptional regulator
MEQVATTLHESCSISVLDNHDVVYIARMPAKRIMSISLAVGSRLPAHATSMGKVLLANLPEPELEQYFASVTLTRMTEHTVADHAGLRRILMEVRELGWAIADEESEHGVRSVAAPILDRTGRVHAAINVSGHASRVSLDQLKQDYLPVVQKAARDISRALGARLER